MPVYKRKYRSGKVVWRYQFTLGATREKQELYWKSGFSTKQEAVAAETTRRAEEQVRKASAGGVAAPMPTTAAHNAAMPAKTPRRRANGFFHLSDGVTGCSGGAGKAPATG